MKDTIKFVGLDVSKDKIPEEGREELRYLGISSYTAIKKLVKKSKKSLLFLRLPKIASLLI